MSNEARAAVIEHSRQKGNAYNLLLAIAERAKAWGFAFPSIADLAHLAHMSERTVQNLLPKLEAAGEVRVCRGDGRGHRSEYWIMVGDLHALAHEKGECSCTLSNEAPPGKGAKSERKGASLDPERVQNQRERVQISAERVKAFAPEPTEPKNLVTEPLNQDGGRLTPPPPQQVCLPELAAVITPDLAAPKQRRTPEQQQDRTADGGGASTPRQPRRAAAESPDLTAVCDLWVSLGLGPVSQTGRTGLRLLVAEHGREWVETGLRRASEQNIRGPVSWLKVCIPGWKREQAARFAPNYGPAPRAAPAAAAVAVQPKSALAAWLEEGG